MTGEVPRERFAVINRRKRWETQTQTEHIEWVVQFHGGSYDGKDRIFGTRNEAREFCERFGYTWV